MNVSVLILFFILQFTTIDVSVVNRSKYKFLNTAIPGVVDNRITFQRDLTYEEIIQYAKTLRHRSTKNRKIHVRTIGKSHQGREIVILKIHHPNAKNIMFIDAGIHAREWLAITTALYLIQTLIESNHTSPINNMNWYIVPLVNPDGYVESYTNDRFHRKNMNYTSCRKESSNCGIDLNRNYEFKWGVASDVNDLYGETYPGVKAFSEKESQAISKILRKYVKDIKLYVALHTYGCDFLYPWGYEEKPCPDYKDLVAAAQTAVDAMKSVKAEGNKCKWTVENAGTMPGGGGADDYAKGALGIKYAYTMELQQGDGNGFTYNNKYILPFVKQNYVGITTLANYVNKNQKNNS